MKDKTPNFSDNTLLLSHVEKSKWDMINCNKISIKTIINGHNFNSEDPLEKGNSLIFNAQTDAEKPFDVYWQVVNTGQEATNAKCLRGEIFHSEIAGSGGLKRKEKTGYIGRHWIECFIVKDNKCVARSNKFIVNITT